MTDYVVALTYEELDPQTTGYEHVMIRAARERPDDLVVYRVPFALTLPLPSGESHLGVLMYMFSKRIIEDAVYLDLFEYFEDWIRVYIKENGWPGKALESKENGVPGKSGQK